MKIEIQRTTWRNTIEVFGLAFALGTGIIGLPITFHPHFEMQWFGVAGTLALVGVISSHSGVRLAAVIFAAMFFLMTWNGYQNGLRHEEFMRKHPELQKPASD